MEDVSASYRTEVGHPLAVLANVSLQVGKGTFCCLVGPSGTGKTTLLNAISGLIPCGAGRIDLDGKTPDAARRDHAVGYVFQKPVLLAWRTVLENLTLATSVAHRAPIGVNEIFERMRDFGLERFADAYPHELSGGLRSRVALLRSLLPRPNYLLLDEAFAHLDDISRGDLYMFLQNHLQITKATAIVVTHSIHDAVRLADQVVVLGGRPARVIRVIAVPDGRPRSFSVPTAHSFLDAEREVYDALAYASRLMN